VGKVEFEHRPPEANNTAHAIARFSFDSLSDCSWVNEPLTLLCKSS
jgi:hypothetical protein